MANQKPECKLIGEDSNIFNLVGIVARTLRRNNKSAEASEMSARVLSSKSYDDALMIISEYVEITQSKNTVCGFWWENKQ